MTAIEVSTWTGRDAGGHKAISAVEVLTLDYVQLQFYMEDDECDKLK